MSSSLVQATVETLGMVGISGLAAFALGLPLGVLLFVTRKGGLMSNPWFNQLLGAVVNAARSIPFIILMLALIPLTKMITGTSIGFRGSLVPLTIAAIPFYARLVETALAEVPKGLVEASVSMGASRFQIIHSVLVQEAMPGILSGLTLTLVNLVGYSAMAGAVGANGLGKLAYTHGYLRYDDAVMISTVVVMIIIVQGIQSVGDYVVKKMVTH